MSKVWLIQNVIAPYRIRLFEEIAKRADFDFRVVLTAPTCHHRPHWTHADRNLAFEVRTMKGLNIGLSDDRSLSLSYGLLGALMTEKPDIVICGGFGISTLLVYVYARLCKKKYIVWSECTETTERVRGVRGFQLLMRRRLAKGADAFVDAGTLSRKYIESLLRSGAKRPFFRAYNCVDASMFARDTCQWDEGNDEAAARVRRMLFVGRLNVNKGIPMLLEAYDQIVAQNGSEVRLVLVGEGPLRDTVEEYTRRDNTCRIQTVGQVPYADVVHYYQACDVLVLLSLSDCNPLVILEALHCGIPIVCTNRAGNSVDFVKPGKNGYIVDPLDRSEIVKRIREILDWNEDQRREAARVSRRLVSAANYADSAQAFIQACAALG
jgi:glycosyltransferase involved in cell wall biosynthesis